MVCAPSTSSSTNIFAENFAENRLKISLHKIFQKFQSKLNKKLHNKRIRKTYIYYVYVIRIRIYRTFTPKKTLSRLRSWAIAQEPYTYYVHILRIRFPYTATPHQPSPLSSVTTLPTTHQPTYHLASHPPSPWTNHCTSLPSQRIRNSTAFLLASSLSPTQSSTQKVYVQ